MKINNYVSPNVEILKVSVEGVLCASGDSGNPMQLPGTEWKDETEW